VVGELRWSTELGNQRGSHSFAILTPIGPDYALDVEPDLLDSPESFEEYAQEALDSLPSDLRARMSNVEIVVEDEPPRGQPLLGLYQGVPLTRRGSYYSGVLPDKITIFRGPLVRLYAHDRERLRREVSRVVLHEVAHHFGISDERLIEIDRY
jgi:predicted Zn-dependent protease with MMP-like domain